MEILGAVLLPLVGLAIGWWIWCREPAATPPSPEVERQLKDLKFVPPIGDDPEIPDAPDATRPQSVHVARGDFRSNPPAPAGEPAVPMADRPGSTPLAGPGAAQPTEGGGSVPAITSADLAVECRAEQLEAAPGRVRARLFGDAQVRLRGGEIVRRGCDAAGGEICDDAGRAALETVSWDWTPPAVARRWDGELRVGLELRDVVYDPRIVGKVGGTWYPPERRVGVAADLSRDLTASRFHPPDWSIAALAAFDVGP